MKAAASFQRKGDYTTQLTSVPRGPEGLSKLDGAGTAHGPP